jgi:hypothetical protein
MSTSVVLFALATSAVLGRGTASSIELQSTHVEKWLHELPSLIGNSTNTSVCWKATKDRGVGTVPESCASNEDKDGALCYPKCKSGYHGVGPVCWERCPSGYIDEGALCRKRGSIKTIAKKSYGRGAGNVMNCGDDKDEDAGLCYEKCPPDIAHGVGPVCWERCPEIDAMDYGAICCRTDQICEGKIAQLATKLPEAIAKAILNGDSPADIIRVRNRKWFVLACMSPRPPPSCVTIELATLPT